MNIHFVCENFSKGIAIQCENIAETMVISKIFEEKKIDFKSFVSKEFFFISYDSNDTYGFYQWANAMKEALEHQHEKYFRPYTAADIYKEYVLQRRYS